MEHVLGIRRHPARVTAIATVGGKLSMIIANDATVKAGAFFPMTCRGRPGPDDRSSPACLLYLVDSAGVFLPLQEDVFPDTDDFGRICCGAVISADGIPQLAAIMGNCVAGGGYLPVLCDTLLMTEGSGLYLAGPALVKAAIGQDVDNEELGGGACTRRSPAPSISEPDDGPASSDSGSGARRPVGRPVGDPPYQAVGPATDPHRSTTSSRAIASAVHVRTARVRLDDDSFNEYKADYGASIVCGYARIDGALRHRRQPAHAHQADDAWWQGWPLHVDEHAGGDLQRFRRQVRTLHNGLQSEAHPHRLRT